MSDNKEMINARINELESAIVESFNLAEMPSHTSEGDRPDITKILSDIGVHDMSKKQIEKLLKAKGIQAESIEYKRSCPTPSGYAKGWDLCFTEKTEFDVFDADRECHFMMWMEFDKLNDVIKWIEKLPVMSK